MQLHSYKAKKIVAREVLILFSACIFLGLFLLIIELWNFYNTHKINSLKQEKTILTEKLWLVPPEDVQSLYQKISYDMVVCYNVDNVMYAINKPLELDFLSEKIYLKQKPVALPGHPEGYFEYILPNSEKILLFEYVTFEKFFELFQNIDYRKKLYTSFLPQDKQEIIEESVYGEKNHRKPVSERSYLYSSMVFTGTLCEFEKYLDKNYSCSQKVQKEKALISRQIQLVGFQIDDTFNSKWADEKINRWIIIFVVILISILYPIRGSCCLIRWALRTIRT